MCHTFFSRVIGAPTLTNCRVSKLVFSVDSQIVLLRLILIFSTQEGERVLDLEPAAPLHRQIANSCSEERAITDAIYFLGEALNRDRIGCDEYLKLVRELSRKQFYLHLVI